MPKVIGEEQTKDILSLLFSGFNISETANKIGISPPTVSTRLRNFTLNAKKEDLMSAARSIGIEAQVKALINLSQDLRKSELEVSDCIAGSDIIKRLEQFNVDHSDLQSFMSSVYTESITQDLKPIDLVALCTELQRNKKDAGKSYREIVDEYRSLRESNQVLREENIKLEEGRRENSRSLRQQVEENKTTLETLRWFTDTRDKIRELGVEVEDIDDLAVLIKNFRENDHDAAKIIEFYTEATELRAKMQELEGEVKSQEQKLRTLTEENKRCEENLESNKELAAAVEDLKSMDLTPIRIRSFIEKIIEISSRQGHTMLEALEDFFSNLE